MLTARVRPSFLHVVASTLVLGVASLLVVAGLAPPAAAHDTLIESAPADGETLDESPSQIELTFSNELLDGDRAIAVTDSAGTTVAEGQPELNGQRAILALDPLEDGEYTVTWSVVSSDGHRIEGDYGFTVASGGAAEPEDEGNGTAGADGAGADDAMPESTQSPDEANAPADGSTGGEQQDDEQSGSPLNMPTWVAVVLAVAILAGIVATIVRLTRRR
ncbi:copper resistance CopC family protein [Georgenia deserti]|uniref:Copper resistance protein CopC n=1 Tax=Georgenia deserti TaxID=2093781 RepID=A0ABW4L6E9_9MICO